MRILINNSQDVSVGSARVHAANLCAFLAPVENVDVTLNDWENYDLYDVVIFGKNVKPAIVRQVRHACPALLIGDTNPSDMSPEKREKSRLVDFFLAGSIEEKDFYLKYKKPVLVFPQIEIFDNAQKHHTEKEDIYIGYHGNKMHIEGISKALLSAIERLGRERRLRLGLLYNHQELGKARITIPGVECVHTQWRLESFAQEVQMFDIGLAPGLTKIPTFLEKFLFSLPNASGYPTDYLLRFKNTANIGRASVFFQLGIPVVADMSPCHFQILGNPDNGYLAHTEEGWYLALKNLSDSADHRNFIAANALAEFNRRYDTRKLAHTFVEELRNLLTLLRK